VETEERADKSANRAFSNVHRLDERLRFPTEPSRINARKLIVPWLASHLRDGDRVVDVAGGIGTYASLLVRERPVEIVGLDISENVIALRSEDPALPENVVGDMESLPFEDASFDAAMFIAALHHVPDPLPALREAFRVVRPGGRLFAFEPASLRARHGNRAIEGNPHEFRMSRSWLLTRVREAGFVVEEAQSLRVAIRILRRVAPANHTVWRIADAVDTVLVHIPVVNRLGEAVRLRATRP
jgi:ubiquinone/menaquinone biosynthesis C-methylase UbiE